MRFAYIFLTLFFSACSSLTQSSVAEKLAPTLAINSVKIASITFEELFFDVNLSVSNHLPFELPLQDVAVNLYYQDKIISTNKITGSTQLKALLQSNVALQSSVQIIDFVKLISDYRSLDFIPIKIEILASIAPIDAFEGYQFKERFELDIPTLHPSAEVKDISLNGANVNVALNLKNRSHAAFSVGDIKYSITQDGTDFSGVAQSTKLDDGSTDINFEVNLLSILSNFKALNFQDSGIVIDSSLQVEGLPYAIPIHVNVK